MNTASSRTPIEVITACGLLSQIDPHTRGVLAGMAKPLQYRAGATVFRQGDPCPGMFIVDTGLVRIRRRGSGGQEHVLHLCGPNQSFGEVAVFAGFDLPADAIAAQATRCVLLPTAALNHELAVNHALCRQLLAGMAFWTRHFVQLLDDIVMRDATERVARLLCDSKIDADGYTILPGSKKDLANHLNLSSETFSRVLKQLTLRGLIVAGPRRAIRVIGAAQLRRLSQPDRF